MADSSKLTLIIGAGEATSIFLRNRHSSDYEVKGIVDDSVRLHGDIVEGVKVIGNIGQLEEFICLYKVKNIIYLIPSSDISKHLTLFKAIQKKYPTLIWLETPPLNDISRGLRSLFELSNVNFLPVNQTPSKLILTSQQKTKVAGKIALITGGAGSIGSKIVEELLAQNLFVTVVVIDNSEMNAYHLSEDHPKALAQKKLIIHLADYGDVAEVDKHIVQYEPTVIYHAAAYKHVNLLENGNVYTAVHNNLVKSLTLAKVIQSHTCIKSFILVSTDKAVNPTNVMGQTKRLVELALNNLFNNSGVDMITVRFGNVIGSNGSVFHKFLRQIEGRQKITLTDKDVTRYFMNISQAASLIIKISLIGERGKVYVLNMGEPIKIYDFLMEMIDKYGEPEQKRSLLITGLRPGEKHFEELYYSHENIQPLGKDLFVGEMTDRKLDVNKLINECTQWGRNQDEALMKKWLSQIIKTQGDNQ